MEKAYFICLCRHIKYFHSNLVAILLTQDCEKWKCLSILQGILLLGRVVLHGSRFKAHFSVPITSQTSEFTCKDSLTEQVTPLIHNTAHDGTENRLPGLT